MTPDVTNLVQLAEFLAVDLDELVLGKEKDLDQSAKTLMNRWQFVARYWWLLFAIGGWLTWFIPRIVHAFH